jgi:DNA-binding PadR family transcriptional regulator
MTAKSAAERGKGNMTTLRTTSQKAMLRDVVERHHEGYEYVWADYLLGHGRTYDRARTAASLVNAGLLECADRERRSGSPMRAYRATPAGLDWVARDRQRDSLGRRRGGPRTAIPPEVITRARQLLAGRTIREVADMVGLHPSTLYMQLYPERHARHLEQRRANRKKEKRE